MVIGSRLRILSPCSLRIPLQTTVDVIGDRWWDHLGPAQGV